MKKTIFLYKKI